MISKHKKIFFLCFILGVAVWYVFALPSRLFEVPYSTVLYDRESILLNASISRDGQWRFPVREEIPIKFRDALVMFEDKRFDSHIGVDPRALYRATLQN